VRKAEFLENMILMCTSRISTGFGGIFGGEGVKKSSQLATFNSNFALVVLNCWKQYRIFENQNFLA